jgi:hypothetical protein
MKPDRRLDRQYLTLCTIRTIEYDWHVVPSPFSSLDGQGKENDRMDSWIDNANLQNSSLGTLALATFNCSFHASCNLAVHSSRADDCISLYLIQCCFDEPREHRYAPPLSTNTRRSTVFMVRIVVDRQIGDGHLQGSTVGQTITYTRAGEKNPTQAIAAQQREANIETTADLILLMARR